MTVSGKNLLILLFDEGTTGRAIADKILAKLNEYQLDISSLRGQCYDGAGNMVGRMNSAAALIQGETAASKTQFFHCSAHALNLCVVATTKVQAVQQMWSILREVGLFKLIVHQSIRSVLRRCCVGLPQTQIEGSLLTFVKHTG